MSILFSTGLSGLNIARTALVTTAHNTANVYTEGYSRQKVIVQSTPASPTGAGFVGTGARVTTVARSYDEFLSAQLTQADSAAQALETYSNQIGRLDDLLADRDSGLSALMQKFFAGVQGVADTPADPAARQEMLSTASALAGKFRSVDSYLDELNASVNSQIAGSVDAVNAIATQVASLNRQIAQLSASAGGQPPNDLLDTRDKLVADLGKIVGVTVVQQDGGQYNLFVGHGHTLVLGDRANTLAAMPSAADPTRTAVALVGAGGVPTELKDGDVAGGAIGGLLAFREQTLVGTRNAMGRIATCLAASFNEQHRLGADLRGVDGADFFSLAGPAVFPNAGNNGTLQLSASVTDASALSASDYAIRVEGDGGGGLRFAVTRVPDGQPIPVTPAGAEVGKFGGFPVSFEGVTVTADAGTLAAGDKFLVQPTRFAARDFSVALTDPAQIAAASRGAPGVSNGANALELAALQRQQVVAGGTATLNGAYARLVSDVGNRALEVQVAHGSQSSLAGQVRASQQAVSGVNQDEETANLLMYQQMYQANAKVIQAASTMFDTILGIR